MRNYHFVLLPNNIHHVHNAIKDGKDAFVKEAINNNSIDVNLELKHPLNEEQKTLLLQAIKYRRTEIIKLLLEKEANLDVADNEGNTPLHTVIDLHAVGIAVKLEIAASLIKKNASLNMQNKKGHTPLHRAIMIENKEVAQFLVENGAAVDIKNYEGDTPLHLLICQPPLFPFIGNLLLEKSEIVKDIQNNRGNTPLHEAICFLSICRLCIIPGEEDKPGIIYRAIRTLMDNGANLNLQNRQGNTPLHLAISNNYEEISNLLLEKGANVDIKDYEGNTPLHLLIRQPPLFPLIGNLLLEKSDIVKNIQNNRGNTPLHEAIYFLSISRLSIISGEEDMPCIICHAIETLIEKGANLNLQNREGNTPLHLAISNNYEKISNLLLEKGANINLKNNEKNTPLHLAVIRSQITVVTKILERIDPLDLEEPGDCKDSDLITLTIRTTPTTLTNLTPLQMAVLNGHEAIISKLLDYGANQQCRDEHGNSLLHIAVDYHNLDAVSSLLEDKDNLNLKNLLGETPLYFAVRRSYNRSYVSEYYIKDAFTLFQRGGRLFGPPESESEKSTLLFLLAYTCKVEEVGNLLKQHLFEIDLIDRKYRRLLLDYVTRQPRLHEVSQRQKYQQGYEEIRNLLERAYLNRVMWDLWALEKADYANCLQWLPKEMVEDVQSFLGCRQCFFGSEPPKRKRENDLPREFLIKLYDR